MRKRKVTKVNLEWAKRDGKTEYDSPVPPKERFIIGDDVRDMFRNRGKNARKKD